MTLAQNFDASAGHYAREWGNNDFRGANNTFYKSVVFNSDGSITFQESISFAAGIDITGVTAFNTATVQQRVGSDLAVNGIAYNSFQDNSTGSYVEKGWVGFGAGDGDIDVKNVTAGEVHLSNAGGRKLSTKASGVSVTGAITTTAASTIKAASGTPLTVESTGLAFSFIGLKDTTGDFTYVGTANGVFKVQTPGGGYSDKLTISSSGDVTIPSGSLSVTGAISATTGVTVATSQDAITNWIDSQEDTGQSVSGSGGSAGTYAASGYTVEYSRHGNKVRVDAVLFQITNKGSWSGDVRLGVPFTCSNNGNVACHGQVVTEHHTIGSNMVATIVNGQDFVRIRFSNTGTTSTFLQWSDLATTAGNAIRFSIEFPVAAS